MTDPTSPSRLSGSCYPPASSGHSLPPSDSPLAVVTGITPGACDDPAVVVGLALRYARLVLPRGLPLPRPITHALGRHVTAGDACASATWDWLAAVGLIADDNTEPPDSRLAPVSSSFSFSFSSSSSSSSSSPSPSHLSLVRSPEVRS